MLDATGTKTSPNSLVRWACTPDKGELSGVIRFIGNHVMIMPKDGRFAKERWKGI